MVTASLAESISSRVCGFGQLQSVQASASASELYTLVYSRDLLLPLYTEKKFPHRQLSSVVWKFSVSEARFQLS